MSKLTVAKGLLSQLIVCITKVSGELGTIPLNTT